MTPEMRPEMVKKLNLHTLRATKPIMKQLKTASDKQKLKYDFLNLNLMNYRQSGKQLLCNALRVTIYLLNFGTAVLAKTGTTE